RAEHCGGSGAIEHPSIPTLPPDREGLARRARRSSGAGRGLPLTREAQGRSSRSDPLRPLGNGARPQPLQRFTPQRLTRQRPSGNAPSDNAPSDNAPSDNAPSGDAPSDNPPPATAPSANASPPLIGRSPPTVVEAPPRAPAPPAPPPT